MPNGYVLAFGRDVTVVEATENSITIETAERRIALKDLAPELRDAVGRLSAGATEDELARIVQATGGNGILPLLYFHLDAFRRHRMLTYGVESDGRLATLVPLTASFELSPPAIDPFARYAFSRFAYLHCENGEMLLESPCSHAAILLHDRRGAAIVSELSEPRPYTALCDRLPDLPKETLALFLQMLLAAAFVVQQERDTPYPEGEALAQWDFHDLLFHARSRQGRQARPYGGTFRFHWKIAPLPAVKPEPTGQIIDLYRPDIEKLEEDDYPFSLVLERRTSIREYAQAPITSRQLGEFLYRTARMKELIRNDFQELTKRPYPGGGAIYELELYPAVRSCEGIPPGLYHYCPSAHHLLKVSDTNDQVEALFQDAQRASGEAGRLPDKAGGLQVLIVIAARFQRMSWKYEAMAYNAMLKNVGVLYQTMYLVATAMDLAPCALGGGDSDLFAQAAGLDYYAETSVGEFLLGSKR